MSDAERADALAAARELLVCLMTPDELETYPVVTHLDDLIEDLRLEVEE